MTQLAHKQVVKEDKQKPEVEDLMDFYHNSKTTLTEVVEIANRENKLIFVDIFADWCTPWKMIHEDVFSSE